MSSKYKAIIIDPAKVSVGQLEKLGSIAVVDVEPKMVEVIQGEIEAYEETSSKA